MTDKDRNDWYNDPFKDSENVKYWKKQLEDQEEYEHFLGRALGVKVTQAFIIDRDNNGNIIGGHFG